MPHPGDILRATAPKDVWVTKDRHHIFIKDLTDSHLSNILRYLFRNVETYRLQAEIELMSYPEPQGEMAQMAYWGAEQALHDEPDYRILEDRFPNFRTLVDEARKRKLPVISEVFDLSSEWACNWLDS